MPPMHRDGFPLPRVETPVRPGTDYELADAVLGWIDETFPEAPLLPWQRYVVRRGFETVEGRLWRQVAFLVSRQQGKTTVMQRVLLARLMLAERFGGTRAVLNTHQDVSQAIALLEPLARQLDFGYLRARSNGTDWWVDAEDVHGFGQGRVWMARAQTRGAITGQAGVGMAYVDELQDARRDIVNRTLKPILSSPLVAAPQVWFTGTGERDDSDLLRDLRAAGEDPDGDVLWLEWSAPPGCETEDRVAWRWASPWWNDLRERSLASDVRTMPRKDFRSEYLVQHDAQVTLWVPPHIASECLVAATDPDPLVAALVADVSSSSWSAAVADREQVRLLVHVPLAQAVAWLRSANPRTLLVYASAARQLPRGVFPVQVATMTDDAAAAGVFEQALWAQDVRIDGGPQLLEQLAHVVMTAGENGPRPTARGSRGDISAVKAAAWALWGARRATEPLLFVGVS